MTFWNMTVKAGAALAVTASLSITGCHAPDKMHDGAEQQVEQVTPPAENDGREPILLHARIAYTSAIDFKGAGGGNTARFLLELRQPAFREGRGNTAKYEQDTDHEAQVVGSVHGRGQAHMVVENGEMSESYDQSATWKQLTVPEQGMFSIQMPMPSHIGDGLSLELEVHAAVSGSKSGHLSSKEASADMEPQVSVPNACQTHSEYLPDHGDACGFKLSLDATPTEPKDEAGKVLFPDLQKGLAEPHGERILAMAGQLYGATTHYRDNGHFVMTYNRHFDDGKDGSSMTDAYHIVVWSTAPDEAWKPSDLPALDDI